MDRPARLRAATRGSTLARIQTSTVGDLLAAASGGTEVEAVVVDTVGDRKLDAPIWAVGGQGVFVKEVQAAVLDGRADIAVHSAKDLPSTPAEGLVIAAIPGRGDPRDALVGGTLAGLPTGARIGTGSVRRRAQLAWLRPDLTFAGLRGNMQTRLDKASQFDAIVVAAAALQRLGRSAERSEVLDPELVVPQVGQGALAVECRADDQATRDLLAAIDHRPSRLAVESERAFLREVGDRATCRWGRTRWSPTMGRSGWRGCSPPVTAVSSCATATRAPTPRTWAGGSPATFSTTPAAPTSSTSPAPTVEARPLAPAPARGRPEPVTISP